jgi:hypothetical protein
LDVVKGETDSRSIDALDVVKGERIYRRTTTYLHSYQPSSDNGRENMFHVCSKRIVPLITWRSERDNRETTERQQRDNRERTERQQRDNRETAERQQRDNRETTEKHQYIKPC